MDSLIAAARAALGSRFMPLVHACATGGCGTLTMGEFCLDCEREQEDALSQPLKRQLEANSERLSDVVTLASPSRISAQ